MNDDMQTIKKRLETKIRENRYELKELSRENCSQIERKLGSEIRRLDFRMASLERLVWNRLLVFFVGFFIGLVIAGVGLMLVQLS